eukprot:Phypoly_transcript_02575.p1 GENE.Phypoly_transcript_02575~~Phypoly_transcript_02575.p1  ORF type:complete len:601 (+),score=89.70 Phypoly_transcript_02575:931-2733(+)
MSVFLDLRAGTIISGDELVVAFIQQSGYLLPSTDPLSSMLIKGDKKNKISGQELNTALDLMQEVLNSEKLKGWKSGIPAICIDHVHSLGSSVDLDPKKPRVSDDSSFLRLIDWVITVTDQKLAHVFFTTTTAFAALDLDKNTSFRERRTLFYVHFLPPEQAKSFLAANFNSQLPLHTQLAPADIDTIINCVGGHLRDLENVLDALLRGDGYMKALRKLITENVQYLVGYMQTLLENYFKEGKDKDAKSKKESCESYLRFWDLMQKLVDNELIDRREVISSIFKEKPVELDNYFVAGIIRYVVAEPQKKDTTLLPTKMNKLSNTTKNGDIKIPNNASLLQNTTKNDVPIPSAIHDTADAVTKDIKATVNPDIIIGSTETLTTKSDDTTTKSNPPSPSVVIGSTVIEPTSIEPIKIEHANGPASGSVQKPANNKESKTQGASTVLVADKGLTESAPLVPPNTDTLLADPSKSASSRSELLLCEQFYIAAGSPRMRTSFKLVLSDQHNIDQRDDILKYLKKQKLKDKEKELDEKRKFWLEELKQFSERVDGMIRHSVQWREVVGADNFSKKVDQALTAETQTLELLRNAEEELTKVRGDLDKM